MMTRQHDMTTENQSSQAPETAVDSLTQQLNHALDQSVENLHPDIRRRLNQAKLAALARRTHPWRRWQPLVAACAVLVLALWIGQGQQSGALGEDDMFAEVLSEDLDMLDDLEFVYWMSEEGDSEKL